VTAVPPVVVEEEHGIAYSLDQTITYAYGGPITNLRQRLVVLPPARHGPQRRLDWSIDVRGVDSARRRARTDSFGNLVVGAVAPCVPVSVTFDVHATVAVVATRSRQPHRIPPDRRYAASTRLTDDPSGRTFARLVRGTRDAATICRRVHESISYEWGVTGVHTSAAEALALGRGVCQDYAHVMLAACRSIGMPARYVSGHLTGEGGSHAWVEVLRPDAARPNSWVVEVWDPTHDRAVGSGYLTVAVGRDYADVAPLSGTFDGTAGGTLTVEKRLTSRTAA
jgi:transglutaminase-like putative cysteine protease